MFLTRITFASGTCKRPSHLEHLVDSYLTELRSEGRIGPGANLARIDGILTAFVSVIRPDALDRENDSPRIATQRTSLLKATGVEPEVTVLEDDVPKRFPNWRNASFFVLYGDYWDDDPPLRRGIDGYPIPAYQLPLQPQEGHNLNCWQEHYQSLMGVWFRSGTLEVPSYRQLADPKSSFARESLEFCRTIESSTGKPVYLHLLRYWGRAKGERNRTCPLCGGKWSLAKPFSCKKRNWAIHFKCDDCHIVSEMCASRDEPRLAPIGEFHPRSRKD